MRKIKLAKAIIQLNLLYWVIYNSYFGWNYTAQSTLEENCDTLFSIMVNIAIVIYIMPLFHLYESVIELLNKKTTN
jgi:hypothetical protein